MDMFLHIVKSPRLQGFAAAIVFAFLAFIFFSQYEIKEFNALGIQFAIPDDSTSELALLNTELTQSRELLAARDKEIEAFKAEDKSSEIHELNRQIERLRPALAESEKLRTEKEIEIKSHKAEVSALTQEIEQLDKKNLALLEQMSAYEVKNRRATDESTKLKEQIVSLSNQLAEKQDLERVNASLQIQISDLERSLTDSKINLGGAESSNCGQPDKENEGEFSVFRNETWRGFSGTLRLRIRKLGLGDDQLIAVMFRSNIDDINDKIFGVGSEIIFDYAGCKYLIEIAEIKQYSESVVIRVFTI